MSAHPEDAWRTLLEGLEGVEDLSEFVDREVGSFLCPSADNKPSREPTPPHLAWVRDAAPGVLPLREIGRGGMGVVFEILDEHTGRREALKILSPHLKDRQFVRRIEREAIALGRLRHPNIATLYSAGVCAGAMRGSPWLRMEFVDGLPILDAFDAFMCDALTRCRILADVADAIGAAHAQGVLHLDLTPGNILVGRDLTPKVLDFGISHLLDDHPSGQTLTFLTHGFGTIVSMAPEQFEGRAGGVCSDVYALGALLYRALTGAHPIDVEGMPFTQAAIAVRTETPRPVRELRPAIPRDVEVIAMTALEKSPKDRYASAWAMRDDLRRALSGKPVLARPIGPVGRCWRLARRHRREAAAIGVGAALLAGTAAFAASQALVALRAQTYAEARLADLRTVATSILFDLNEQLERIPGTVEIRANVLRSTLEALTALEAEAARDPEVAALVVRAYTRAGEAIGHVESSSLGLPAAHEPLEHAVELGQRALDRFPSHADLSRATAVAMHRAYFWSVLHTGGVSDRSLLERAARLLTTASELDPGRLDDDIEHLVVTISTLHHLRNHESEPGLALDGFADAYKRAEQLAARIDNPERAIELLLRAALPVGVMARESGRHLEGLPIQNDAMSRVASLRPGTPLRPVLAMRTLLLRADFLLLLAQTGAPIDDRTDELRRSLRECREIDDASALDDTVRRTAMVMHMYAAETVLAGLNAAPESDALLSATDDAIAWCDWALARLRQRIETGVAAGPDRTTYEDRILRMRAGLEAHASRRG